MDEFGKQQDILDRFYSKVAMKQEDNEQNKLYVVIFSQIN